MCSPVHCRYLSQATHLVLDVAADGTLRAVAPLRPRPLGFEAAALVGRRLADLVPANLRDHLARVLQRCRGTPAVWDHLTFVSADGRPEPMLCCFQRLADAPEPGLLVTGLRLESVESDLRAEAAAAFGRLAFQSHGPAHRLMQALEAMVAEHPQCEAARRCRSDLDALLDVVSLSVAWPPDLPADRPVDAIRVLEASLRLVEAAPGLGRMEVALRPECPAAWTNVHPVALAAVALHLVSNARDATAGVRGPRLHVDVHCAGDGVVLEFRDNGRGLGREDVRGAFTPAAHGSQDDGHAGLGLAACYELLRSMGGRMQMQSRPRRGTTVVVRLPAAAPPPA